MSETDEIRGLESVHRIKAIESTYEVRAVKQDIVYLRQKALLLQRNAVLTGDWTYYAQLLDIQDRIRRTSHPQHRDLPSLHHLIKIVFTEMYLGEMDFD